ncbi:hypothetical protein VPHD479_0013 [Vibrio phage D479]
MIEFITERKSGDKWYQGSRGEVAHNVRKIGVKKGGVKGAILSKSANLIAKVAATGTLGRENRKIQQAQTKMEAAGVSALRYMNYLEASIKSDRPRDEIVKSAKLLKGYISDTNKAVQEVVRLIDRYQRLDNEEKRSRGLAGAIVGADEFSKYDFQDFYRMMNDIEDVAFNLNKAATAAITNDYEYALRQMHAVKGIL